VFDSECLARINSNDDSLGKCCCTVYIVFAKKPGYFTQLNGGEFSRIAVWHCINGFIDEWVFVLRSA